MSAEKATAIVLRVIEFSESSSVVTLYTREFGKISGLAKGARKPKGPFESALDLLAVCRILFLRKSSTALDLLTEAKLDRRFRPCGRDISRLYAGYYIAELLSDLTDEYDPHADLFELADETLLALTREENGSPLAWVVRFELALLRIVGHLPSFDTCAECGETLQTTKRVTFALLAGGVLCQKCREGHRQLVSVHNEAMQTLHRIAQSSEQQSSEQQSPANSDNTNNLEDWHTLTIPAEQRGEIRGVLNQYLAHLLGKRPRMTEYLGMISH